MKGKFTHISNTLRECRVRTPYSQQDLSIKLGYKSVSGGQFISNAERGKCGLPAKKMVEVASILGVDVEVFKAAAIEDFKETLEAEVAASMVEVNNAEV